MSDQDDTPELTDKDTGLIYLSHIPEGMNPSSLRHLLSQHAEIGRIYLIPYGKNLNQDPGDPNSLINNRNSDSNDISISKKKRNTYNTGRYKEGWVEFENKRKAKKIARILNMSEIATKKNGAWKGQFWSMKYLHKFKDVS